MSIALQQTILVEDDRTGLHVETLKRAILDNLFYIAGRFAASATPLDYYTALAYTVRDRMLAHWLKSIETNLDHNVRVVSYLSAEFLMGPHLGNNILNLGIGEQIGQAARELDLNLEEILNQEAEPGLGNGGLGRATWTPWRRSAFRPSAMASVTSSAFSTRRFTTAGKSRSPISGCGSEIRGRSAGRNRL